MTYINSLGKNYAEEYKEFGKKVITESEEILKKAGILTPVFNTETENNPMEGYAIVHQDKSTDKKMIPNKKTIRVQRNFLSLILLWETNQL